MDIFNDKICDQLDKLKNLFTLSGINNLLNLDNNLIDLNSFLNAKFEDDEEYMDFLYEHKWHPYTGYELDYQLVKDIMQIKRSICDYQLADSMIYKTIFYYYDSNSVKGLKRKWSKYIKDYRKRILIQSLSAFSRYEYALTICALIPMWFVFINNIANTNEHKISKIITKYNDIMSGKNYSEIYNEFFNRYIFYDCRDTSQVVSDVPGRHAIAHGYFNKYPSKKSALNAIIFTDLLVDLEKAKP